MVLPTDFKQHNLRNISAIFYGILFLTVFNHSINIDIISFMQRRNSARVMYAVLPESSKESKQMR